jgi:SIR2-like domain
MVQRVSERAVKYVLLLGAGFSRNWGGWLASEVNGHLPTSTKVRGNAHVADVLRRSVDGGGFEAALAELQEAYAKAPTPENLNNLQSLQEAILAMFADMEAGFASRPGWDFSNYVQFKLARFLSPFDAVFSLNQDLLFERHFHGLDLALAQPKKWFDWERPGIQALADDNHGYPPDVGKIRWTPRDPTFTLNQSSLPYFKLHGSWNWWSRDGEQMLIMGGNKVSAVERNPLLKWYHEQFEAYLSEPGSRLMVIGYGFADPHINETIARAANANPALSLFQVHPRGRAVIPDPLKEIADAGTSTRLLSETFAGDEAERRKIMRFFE